MLKKTNRAENEIRHGKYLAECDTERIWGWGTQAGQLRARRRADMIIALAQIRPGMRVLEIGCGTGNFTEFFVKAGCEIVAVDISPNLLEKAEKRRIPYPQVRFMEMRFEDAGSIGPFDAIIGSSILHHLEITVALTKIKELLRPGGRMSFAEPNLLNPQVYLERKFSHWKFFSHISPDETAFIRHKLKLLLKKTGYCDITITPFDWLHPATPELMIPYVTGIASVLEKTPIINEFAGSLAISAQKPLS